MSELKVYEEMEDFLGYEADTPTEMYDKSEADKVIAHHKYKRCLAMAKWCESEEKHLEVKAPLFDTDKEFREYNSDFLNKWHKRWLEIATKFKEAK